MIARAKLGGMIPYSDLTMLLRPFNLVCTINVLFIYSTPKISPEEDAAGLGMLSAIVVHRSEDMQPGPFF